MALAEAHNRLAEWDDAARVAQSGLLSHPDSVAGRLALAVAEAGRGRGREALEQIKRALINDQENPRALALMGSLLLEKGLAKRAVQFLSKAVKLAPDSREYGDLLRRARRLALQDPDIPVSRSEQIADEKSPWTDNADETDFAAGEPKRPERTVYDPDGLFKGRAQDVKASERKAEFERALAQLGDDDEPRQGDAEPTQYGGPKSGARKPGEKRAPTSPFSVEAPESSEERTTHELHQLKDLDLVSGEGSLQNPDVSGLPKKPKMGGSAAEYSRMIKSEDEPGSGRLGAVVPKIEGGGEFTFAAPEGALAGGPLFEAPTVDGVARELLEKNGPSKNGSSPFIQSEVKSNKSLPAVEAEGRSGKYAAVSLDGAGKPKIIKARDAKEREVAPDTTDEDKKSQNATVEAPPSKGEVPSRPSLAAIKAELVEAPPKPKAEPEPARSKKASAPAPAAEKPAPSPEKPAEKPAEPAPEPPKSKKEPEPAPAPKPKKEKAAAAEKAAEKPAAPDPAEAGPPPGGERPATMFVDDAVWKLYGSEKPLAPKADAPPKGEAPAKPAAEKHKAADEGAAPDRRQGMVVRTSERFGSVTRWTVIGVAAIAAGVAGFVITQRRAGAGDVDVRDEKLIEVATDLERGGLARLSSAEETLEQLLPVAPELAPIAHAALAEIRGRTWAGFGKSPKVREKARQDLAAIAREPITIEALAARVALATGAKDLAALEAQLGEAMKRHPRSPKALLLQAELADRLGRPEQVARALYAARAENPRRRDTLLALARWNGARGAYAAAFALFDEISEAYPEDVEAALDRWILGQLSGADPSLTEAAGRLAGLVREEIPEVAKDEAGRVALAFGVAALARGDTDEGLLQLGRAGAAFEASAEFKSALGTVYLALGDWAQAKEHFEKAIAADPDAIAPRIGRARALYGEQSELTPPKETKPKAGARGEAVLPFGRARLVFARFTPVEVTVGGAFPEAAYAAAAGAEKGAALDRALESANVVAVAVALRTRDPKRAVEILERAREKGRDPALDTELGRAYLSAGELDRARRAFESALAQDGAHHPARLGLAEVLLEQKRPSFDAIGVLEPLLESGVVMPDALRLLARLKKQSGDYAAAFQILERAREVEELNPELQEALGELHHLLGRKEEAFHAYRRAAELVPPGTDGRQVKGPGRGKAADDPSAVDLYYRGRVNLERNEKKALALLASALRKDDAPAEAHFYLGKALIKKPKTRKQGRKELETYRRLVPDGELSVQADRLIRGR